ncbi:PHP domain-containing protein [Serpentinicella sp. ANB-PHB4]|uniref:PHP domain-containing protein n=1 Tax=Serpentinicella sp. ANB-PHB4 TaxID=3074076 RepID=UPI002863B47D|nr:PHP domain-containing protein [Serpentinicella sp. ANB-PHB4]MDR5658135.1 PHP domain-containing protein [Serpentinicella sp. ANB-PHB4]
MDLIDMHTHTTSSDGSLSSKSLIDYAIKKGLQGLSITDHDTVEGLPDAVAYAKKFENFTFIPGIELSTEYKSEEIHILGYNIDFKSNSLITLLDKIKFHRESRAEKIINKLNSIGMDISYEEVSKYAKGVIGRPHIAQVLIEKNYVETFDEAFRLYLNINAPAYVPRYKITPKEAVDVIRLAGGYAVLAHPGLINNRDITQEIISCKINGLEVFYPTHTEDDISDFLKISNKHNLITTGGSDFHRIPDKTSKRADLGTSSVPVKLIENMISV